MGIDLQTRLVLDYAKKNGYVESDVLFVGSPSLVLTHEPTLDPCRDYLINNYPNGWESVDISQNQDVDFVADFAVDDLGKKFKFIVDHGSLQHFYDPFSGLKNILRHLAPGGVAVHMLPFTGYGGFGYWQISPSIFLGLEKMGMIKILKILYFSQYNDTHHFTSTDWRVGEFHFSRRTRVCVVYQRKDNPIPKSLSFFQNSCFDHPQAKIYKKSANRLRFIINQVIAVLWEELMQRPAPWRGDNRYLRYCKNKDLL